MIQVTLSEGLKVFKCTQDNTNSKELIYHRDPQHIRNNFKAAGFLNNKVWGWSRNIKVQWTTKSMSVDLGETRWSKTRTSKTALPGYGGQKKVENLESGYLYISAPARQPPPLPTRASDSSCAARQCAVARTLARMARSQNCLFKI